MPMENIIHNYKNAAAIIRTIPIKGPAFTRYFFEALESVLHLFSNLGELGEESKNNSFSASDGEKVAAGRMR